MSDIGVADEIALIADARAKASGHNAVVDVWCNEPTLRRYIAVIVCPHGQGAIMQVRDADYADLYYDNAKRMIELWFADQRRAWADGCCATQEETNG